MESDLAWVLALSITLTAATTAAALWILWGCIKVLKMGMIDAGERASQVQARWLARELAGGPGADVAAASVAQADKKGEKEQLVFHGAQPPDWDELGTLVQ